MEYQSVNVPSKAKLSESTMRMKFMQRKHGGSGLKCMKTDERASASTLTSGNRSEVSKSDAVPSSASVVIDLWQQLPGRRSFGGFNKVVERRYVQICEELGFKNVDIGTRKKAKKQQKPTYIGEQLGIGSKSNGRGLGKKDNEKEKVKKKTDVSRAQNKLNPYLSSGPRPGQSANPWGPDTDTPGNEKKQKKKRKRGDEKSHGVKNEEKNRIKNDSNDDDGPTYMHYTVSSKAKKKKLEQN
jgi:hypothetical protein